MDEMTAVERVAVFGAGPRAYALVAWLNGLCEADRNLVLLHVAQRHPDEFADARLALHQLRARQTADFEAHTDAALRVVQPMTETR